ncbi:hypothetical protein [Carbonactinospora thermoautotrophica]|uniref:hypothetical protein n=1 Tax=Carbonactinospora thermoautotrophica TaxID=1469144 RepID=UPI0038B2751C
MDWWPWAFAEAYRHDAPVLLSVDQPPATGAASWPPHRSRTRSLRGRQRALRAGQGGS